MNTDVMFMAVFALGCLTPVGAWVAARKANAFRKRREALQTVNRVTAREEAWGR